MAFSPIAFTIPEYDRALFSNWWLKPYEPGTTTPKPMATDETGNTQVSRFELNSQGFPQTAGGALVIPFIDGRYDLFLFPTAQEADDNDTTNALMFADNILAGASGEIVTKHDSVADMIADLNLVVGDLVRTASYYNNSASDTQGSALYRIMTLAQFGTAPDEFGDHTLDNGLVAKLITADENDVRWWGAIADFSYGSSEGGDTGTDNQAPIQAAIDRLQTLGHPTGFNYFDKKAERLNFAGLDYGISGTLIMPNDSGGLEFVNGKLASLPGFTGNNLLEIGQGGSEEVWMAGCRNITFDCRKRTSGLLLNSTQKCWVDTCFFGGYTEHGLKTETVSGALFIRNSVAQEYAFDDPRADIDTNYTGIGFLMTRADWIMHSCVSAVSKVACKISGGFNWQISACHFWQKTTDGNADRPVLELDNTDSGIISNLYIDNGSILIRGSFFHHFTCLFGGPAQGGSANILFRLVATAAGQNAAALSVSGNRTLYNNVFSYETEGAGTWKDTKRHIVETITRDNGDQLVSYPLQNWRATAGDGSLEYNDDDDGDISNVFPRGLNPQIKIGSNTNSTSSALLSFDLAGNSNWPSFFGAIAPSGTVGDFSLLPTDTRVLTEFWGTGSNGTNFGDGGTAYRGGGGLRVVASENWTVSALGTKLSFFTTQETTETPVDTYTMEFARFSPVADNVKQLGGASNRWSEVFAGNGTINTSDEREKEQIEDIPDSVLNAWAEVPKRRFKWRQAVASKGDGARWHVGVIAQDIISAFASQGLDARQWGVLCEDDGRYGVRYDQAAQLDAALERRERHRLEALIKKAL